MSWRDRMKGRLGAPKPVAAPGSNKVQGGHKIPLKAVTAPKAIVAK